MQAKPIWIYWNKR